MSMVRLVGGAKEQVFQLTVNQDANLSDVTHICDLIKKVIGEIYNGDKKKEACLPAGRIHYTISFSAMTMNSFDDEEAPKEDSE